MPSRLFSLSKLRTRGRSVDPRPPPPSQSNQRIEKRQPRQLQSQQRQQQQQPQRTSTETHVSHSTRSLSQPPPSFSDTHQSRESLQLPRGYESDGSRRTIFSSETSDGEFLTAFDRSPPSFGDELLEEEGGIFPRRDTVDSPTKYYTQQEERWEISPYDCADPPAIIHLLEEDDLEGPIRDGDLTTKQSAAKKEKQHSSHTNVIDAFGDMSIGVEWFAFDEQKNHPKQQCHHQNTQRGQSQHQQYSVSTPNDWEDIPTRNNKNPRLVSPSPSPLAGRQTVEIPGSKSTLQGLQHHYSQQQHQQHGTSRFTLASSRDDLRAWGMAQDNDFNVPQQTSTSKITIQPSKSNKKDSGSSMQFETDFFATGFESAFDDDCDVFFGKNWMEIKDSVKNGDNTTKMGLGKFDSKNSSNYGKDDDAMWSGMHSFYTSNQQASSSSSSSSPMEKNDTVNKDSSQRSMSTRLLVKNNKPPEPPIPIKKFVNPEVLFDHSNANLSTLHPLKHPPPQDWKKSEVVVSFEGFDGLHQASSSSHIKTDVHKIAHTTTTGVNNSHYNHKSNQNDIAVPMQQSLHQRVPSNGSVNSHQHQNHNRKKGGGSVGSNSSAVDQILEQYRQKRLAKQHGNGGIMNTVKTNASNSHQQNPPYESSLSKIRILEKSVATRNASSSLEQNIPPMKIPQLLPPQQQQQNNGGPSPIPSLSSPQSSSFTLTSGNGLNYQSNLNAAVSEISDRLRIHRQGMATDDRFVSPATVPSDADQFLLANIEATIGPRGVAPDMESLSGRSHRSSQFSHLQQGRSSPRHSFKHYAPPRGDSVSVDSRTSRNSFRSYRSNRSALTNMSKESQSVANDLFRLEAQLAEVAKQQQHLQMSPAVTLKETFSQDVVGNSSTSDLSIRSNNGTSIIGAEPVPRPSPFEVIAPPGKLGILLANQSKQSGPTHVSAVRSESVLAGNVHVGDRFLFIDGEDVSKMNSKEITAIMSRKSEFERILVLLPLHASQRAQEWI